MVSKDFHSDHGEILEQITMGENIDTMKETDDE